MVCRSHANRAGVWRVSMPTDADVRWILCDNLDPCRALRRPPLVATRVAKSEADAFVNHCIRNGYQRAKIAPAPGLFTAECPPEVGCSILQRTAFTSSDYPFTFGWATDTTEYLSYSFRISRDFHLMSIGSQLGSFYWRRL